MVVRTRQSSFSCDDPELRLCPRSSVDLPEMWRYTVKRSAHRGDCQNVRTASVSSSRAFLRERVTAAIACDQMSGASTKGAAVGGLRLARCVGQAALGAVKSRVHDSDRRLRALAPVGIQRS